MVKRQLRFVIASARHAFVTVTFVDARTSAICDAPALTLSFLLIRIGLSINKTPPLLLELRDLDDGAGQAEVAVHRWIA